MTHLMKQLLPQLVRSRAQQLQQKKHKMSANLSRCLTVKSLLWLSFALRPTVYRLDCLLVYIRIILLILPSYNVLRGVILYARLQPLARPILVYICEIHTKYFQCLFAWTRLQTDQESNPKAN